MTHPRLEMKTMALDLMRYARFVSNPLRRIARIRPSVMVS